MNSATIFCVEARILSLHRSGNSQHRRSLTMMQGLDGELLLMFHIDYAAALMPVCLGKWQICCA